MNQSEIRAAYRRASRLYIAAVDCRELGNPALADELAAMADKLREETDREKDNQ